MSNEYNEALLEPLKYYRESLKDTFQSITEDYFQELVNQSKVDINKNKDLIDKYTNVSENRDQSNSTYKRFGIIRTIDFIVGIGSLVYCVSVFTTTDRYPIHCHLHCYYGPLHRFVFVLD